MRYVYYSKELYHHGIKGQKWGVRRFQNEDGTYTEEGKARRREEHIKRTNKVVLDAIEKGIVSVKMNKDKQLLHIKENAINTGKSYIDGNLEKCEKLINKLYATGTPIFDSKGKWTNKERVENNTNFGVYPEKNSNDKSNKGTIVYSKTGTHIMVRKKNFKKGDKK